MVNENIVQILVPIPENEKLLCKLCNATFDTENKRTRHIIKIHQMQLEDYLVQVYMNGIRPTCPECGDETRYHKGKYIFSKYCKTHTNKAKAEWSKNRGMVFDPGWRKGLTKETNSSIAAQAEKMMGENNIWHKNHSPHLRNKESVEKANETRLLNAQEKYREAREQYAIEKNIEFVSTVEEYIDQRTENIRFKCLNCDEETVDSWVDLKYLKSPCPHCRTNEASKETRQKLSDHFRFSEEQYQQYCEENENFDVLTPYENYGRQKSTRLVVKCRKCGDETTRTLQCLRDKTDCWKCNARSIQETEIQKLLESHNIKVERNTRTILPLKELDFYCPEHNFAIEFNGLYWHCNPQKPDNYHREKTDLCEAQDIQLFHIFEDEWKNKREIIESMLFHRLGITSTKIYARNCTVREIDKSAAKEFFDRTHISGNVNCKVVFGLFHNEELVSCISLREPIQRKYKGNIEIARFSSELNTSVVGGFGKLLKKVAEWCQANDFSGIMTYADLRFGTGNVYEQNGFELIGDTKKTGLNYWYTNWKERLNRSKYRAKEGISEQQIAEKAGVYKIFGCGSRIFLLTLP